MSKQFSILLFAIFLLFPLENFGQKVTDVGKKDYIYVDWGFEMIKKIKDQTYLTTYFKNLYPETYEESIPDESIQEGIQEGGIVSIKKFSTLKPRDYEKFFDKKELIYTGIDDTDTVYPVITMYNPYVVCILPFDSSAHIYEKNRNKYFWENRYSLDEHYNTHDVKFYNYSFIKSGKKHFMRLFEGNKDDKINEDYNIYLVPKKGCLFGYDYDNDWENFTLMDFKPQADDLYDIAKRFMDNEEHYRVRKNEKGESIICNVWGDKIFPQAFDSILIKTDMIIAEKDGEYHFINSKLELLPVKARSVSDVYLGYRVLVGNEVKTLTLDGVLTDIIPYPVLHTDYAGSYNPKCRYSFTKNDAISLFLTKIYKDGRKTQELIWHSKADEKVEDLYTVRGINVIDTDYFYDFPPLYVLVKNKNGKYGISVFEKHNPFQLIEKLPAAYDSITGILSHVYPFLSEEEHSFLLYKNGLMGYYPFMKEAKYKEIEIDVKKVFCDKFIRFTLPDGRKGWFNIENKKEYLDL